MGYPKFNPLRDCLSGLIMAATSVPQLIAYAETVGYAGYRGLSTAGPSLFVWGLATGSPYLNSGVTSITALMTKTDLSGDAYVQSYGEEEYVKAVAAYSLYVGLASIALAVVGFGGLAQSVPKPVRSGFKWGCSVGVLVSAVPNGLFAQGSRELKQQLQLANGTIPHTLSVFLKTNLPAATGATSVLDFFFALFSPQLWSLGPAMLFIIGTIVVLKGKDFLPKSFPPGTEVILVTAVATLISIHLDYAGAIVGEIPSIDDNTGISLGPISIPIELLNMKEILFDVPVVSRCFGSSVLMLCVSATLFAAVNFLSIMGIASGFEAEDGIPWSARRELTAQGLSCLAAAVVGSAPVSGSLSRSLVSRMTGTTSSAACLVTALAWIYGLPLMGLLMAHTPKAALAAVICSAVVTGVCMPKDLWTLKGWLNVTIGWMTGILTALTSPTIGFGGGLLLFFILNTVFGDRTKATTAKKAKEE